VSLLLLLRPRTAGGGGPSFVVVWGATDEDDVWGVMRKNVAGQFISAQLVNAADGSAFTGSASVTVTVDNGSQTAGGGTVTHKGGGEHSYALTQAETNGDRVAVKFSGSGAVSRTINVYTGFPQTGDSYPLVDTEVAAIKAKTDNLPVDPADASDIAASFATVNSTLSTIAGYIDTEVAAIKAKTDNLPAAPAAVSDIPTAAVVADAVWDEARSGHTTTGTFGESYAAIVAGQCITGTLSTTAATTDLTEATDDHYIGRTIVWITGVLAGQASAITDYAGATKTLTYALVTDAPSNGDRFVLV